ncbi:MAG: N-succinylarginine dihydrolase [Gammaproteobacteria bacterium]|nr:N-succinylarginine dihydrolase [Gammaproteobacteria bacterium]
MSVVELNIDGLVGPTHHYAGLAFGNTASTNHAHQLANPREAALQGLKKMRLLFGLGIKQAFLPPPPRLNLALLHHLGFQGTPTEQLTRAFRDAPQLLSACYSASSMWTANAATVSSHLDTIDGKTHITPANLISQLHRFQETAFTREWLRLLCHDERYFAHHDPLPSTLALADEGAANHNRLALSHAHAGLSMFVYGKSALPSTALSAPVRFPARQTLEASQAISRLHGLSNTVFVQQHPISIDAGVFHNDVISLANESVFLVHENAFVEQTSFLKTLQQTVDFPLHLVEITAKQLSLKEAISSYLFNSQLLTLPDQSMVLIAPVECQQSAAASSLIQAWIQDPTLPIQHSHFIDLKQSMQNGGGPACLRLRMPLSEAALQTLHPALLITQTSQLDALEQWVQQYYRDRLAFEDLADPALMVESIKACEALYRHLKILAF